MRNALLLFLCSVSLLVFGDVKRERRPASESYTDQETGLVFPAVMGGFVKTETIRNFNPLIGTTIRYSGPEGGCADIYVYLLSIRDQYLIREDVEKHGKALVKAVHALPGKVNSVKKVRILSENDLPGWPFYVRETVFSLQTDSGNIRNVLLLLGVRRHILKLRFSSGNKAAEEAFSAFRKAFLELCAKGI